VSVTTPEATTSGQVRHRWGSGHRRGLRRRQVTLRALARHAPACPTCISCATRSPNFTGHYDSVTELACTVRPGSASTSRGVAALRARGERQPCKRQVHTLETTCSPARRANGAWSTRAQRVRRRACCRRSILGTRRDARLRRPAAYFTGRAQSRCRRGRRGRGSGGSRVLAHVRRRVTAAPTRACATSDETMRCWW